MLKIISLLILVLTALMGIVPLEAQTTDTPTAINQKNAHELVEIASLPVKGLAHVAWSPIGDKMAVVDAASIRIYDAQTFELNKEALGYGDVLDLVYSPDGRYLAIATLGNETETGKFFLIRVDAPDEISLLVSQTVTALSFSADSRLIAFVTQEGYITIYNVESRTLNHVLPFIVDHALGLAFDPNKNELAIADNLGNMQLWDVNQQALVDNLSAERASGGGGSSGLPWGPRYIVAYSLDGQYIVSGTTQWVHPLRLWNRAAKAAVAAVQREGMTEQGDKIFLQFNSAAFNTDGTLLVTTAGDPHLSNMEVNVWDVQAVLHQGVAIPDKFPGGELITREPLISFSQPGVTTAVFNPANTFLAAAGSSTVTVWGLKE